MSDAEDKSNMKPTPETASVPLKKETIRVTLRANPDAAAEAPGGGAAPAAPKAPAPTIPLGGGAPKPAAPAPTVRLNTPSKPITPGGPPAAPATAAPTRPLTAAPTKPLTQPGAASQPLPKATVNLGTTQLPSTPGADTGGVTQATNVSDDTQTFQLDEPESKVVPMVMSIILFLLSAFVLFTQYTTNTKVDPGFQVISSQK